MKIVSQLSNAVPDTTGKSAHVDTSTNNFQATFANAKVGAVIAAGKPSNSKTAKTQGVETKKASNSEGNKKSSTSSLADEAIPAQLRSNASQSTAIASPVVLITAPNVEPSSGATADQFSGKLVLPSLALASGTGEKSDVAQIAELAAPSLPNAPEAEVAPTNPSAEKTQASGPDVPDTLAKQVLIPIAAAKAASMPTIKAPDKADSQRLGAVGTASQSKAAASAGSNLESGSSATDALQPSTFPLPVAAPQSVPQQTVAQDMSGTAAISNPSSFKVPPAKSEAPVGASPIAASTKGKATSAQTNGETDDKQTATATDSESMKSRIGAAEVVSKDVSSGGGDFAQGTALAQSTDSAQVVGPTPSVDAQGSATQSITNAASPAAPAQPASAENVQAAHAMSSAQLIQSVHGSEMRLGMQSAEFGNISINTSLSHQALSAQISIDHAALGHALAVHLPAIEEKLGSAYGVQARVELRDTGSNGSQNDSSNRESKGNGRSQTADNGTSTAFAQSPAGALTNSTYTSVAASSSRLDIRI